tara:strand:- start:1658 stop:2206 length:549 start_codon:yes stop_codon:yes gene_type:complete
MDKLYKLAREEGKYGIPQHFKTFVKPFALRLWDIIEKASYADVKKACENIVKNEYHFQFTYLKNCEDYDSKLQQFQYKVADIVEILTMDLDDLAKDLGVIYAKRDHKDLMNQWLYGHIHGEFQFSLDSRSTDYNKTARISYSVKHRPLAEFARNTDIVYMGKRNESRTDAIELAAEELEENS